MKVWTIILLFLSFPALARDHSMPSDLDERIRTLEIIVRQLQDEVDRLHERRPAFTCLLNATLGGAFHGKGETMLEAKAKSLNACERNSKAFCDENKVICEKSDL